MHPYNIDDLARSGSFLFVHASVQTEDGKQKKTSSRCWVTSLAGSKVTLWVCVTLCVYLSMCVQRCWNGACRAEEYKGCQLTLHHLLQENTQIFQTRNGLWCCGKVHVHIYINSCMSWLQGVVHHFQLVTYFTCENQRTISHRNWLRLKVKTGRRCNHNESVYEHWIILWLVTLYPCTSIFLWWQVETLNPDGTPAEQVEVVLEPMMVTGRTEKNGMARLSINTNPTLRTLVITVSIWNCCLYEYIIIVCGK